MIRVESHRVWLRRFIVPSILLTLLVIVWGAFLSVALYRSLGVTIQIGGQPGTLVDEIMIHGPEGFSRALLLHLLVLFILFVARVRFRAWVMATVLIVVGTPLAFLSGRLLFDYLWSMPGSGIAYEGFAPQAVFVMVAWGAALILDGWLLRRYRIVIVRRDDQRKSPCPRCGYELHGAASRQCPECGWVIPPCFRLDESHQPS